MRNDGGTLLVATVLFVGALGSGLAWYRQSLRAPAPVLFAASPGYLAAETAEEAIYRRHVRAPEGPIDEQTLHLCGAVICGITSLAYLFVLAAPFFLRHGRLCQPWRTWQLLFLGAAVLVNLLCLLVLALASVPKTS